MPRFLLTLSGLLTVTLFLRAEEPLDPMQYLTVKKGGVPILVSAPHGGRVALPGVPVRKGEGVAKFVVVNDSNTDELALKLAAEIKKQVGAEPYLVMARFERKFVDANRPAEGAYESLRAKPIYDAYHKGLQEACREIQKNWGRGLLLDLHGQAAEANTIFRGTGDLKSLDQLKTRYGLKAINGPNSVLGSLEKKGYKVFPASTSEEKENPKFNGGFITRTYGSEGNTGLDALQLELGGNHRSKKNLDQTAQDLAAAVKMFAKEFLPQERLKAPSK
jgi:N-formylglutamate amidohydrolase